MNRWYIGQGLALEWRIGNGLAALRVLLLDWGYVYELV